MRAAPAVMSVESARELGLKAPRLRGGVVGRIEWGEDPRVQLFSNVAPWTCRADLAGATVAARRAGAENGDEKYDVEAR